MKYVVGVDSGGSKTRALIVVLDGTPVDYAETGGGNPAHNPQFKTALGDAILRASKNIGIANVVQVVSGIAGFDQPSDLEWAIEATTVEGLTADQIHVNDTEIAHFGAYSGSHGIVSIQGHGSNVLRSPKVVLGLRTRIFYITRVAAPWSLRCVFILQ